MTNLTTSPHHRHNLTTSGSAGNDDTLDLVLAVVFTVASAAANSLGLVMQKWAKKPCGLWWIFGNLVFQSGSLLMAAGLAFGEQLLVAPLGALVMVFNIPFSHCFLKEKASPWDILGSVFIMAGVICVALFGPVSDTKPTADQLDDLLLRPVFIGVESSILVFMLVVALVAHFEAKKVISDHEVKIAFAALHEPLAAGFLGEEGSSSDYGLSHHERPAGTDDDEVNTKTAEPESLQLQLDSFRSYFLFFGYAILMAMSSGFLMCAAQLLEILVIDAVNNKTGPNLATNGLFWGPLVFLVVFLVLQSKFANNGLRLFSALTLVPTIQLFNQIGVAAIGAVYFEEFDFYDTHTLYAGLFAMAIALLFAGLIIILVCRHRALQRTSQKDTNDPFAGHGGRFESGDSWAENYQ